MPAPPAIALRGPTVPAQFSALQGSDVAITGHVLDPDGKPVTTGTVALMTTANARVSAIINQLGEFRIVPDAGQRQSLFISVPGFAAYRAYISVPASRRMALPDI